MKKTLVLIITLALGFVALSAQETTTQAAEQQKSGLHKRAEAVDPRHDIATARSLYIQAFSDYANRGQMDLGMECAVKATALYYRESFYQEAFDLLRHADQLVSASSMKNSRKAALHYLATKERLQMYMKMRKAEKAKDQLNTLEAHAAQAADENVSNDLLYTKAIYYYTFGMNAQGNEVFQEMAAKLTAQKEYDKVDEVFRTLISNGRKSNNVSMVAQSYSKYMAWKDSVSALKTADEIGALKQQIADNEASIAEKDSSLSTRQMIIVGLCILAAALAAALVIGALVLMRFIMLTRKQKKIINLANESNALKARFISNISAQMEPTLKKLDSRIPEVKALLDFSDHVQVLSNLENTPSDSIEMQETDILPFCEKLMDGIRDKVKSDVTLKVNSPHMSAKIHPEYVSHIVSHLLANAAAFTPEGGTIVLDFKKRGAHTYQFLVSDTGVGIPEEKREDIFKPFLEIHDLTKGDGLGLPICKQMALKMGGDIDIDPQFTKGTRFVLHLHA